MRPAASSSPAYAQRPAIASWISDIYEEYKILLNELKQYNPELLDKQRILAISKCDTIDEELITELEKDLNKRMKGKFKIPYLFFSSQTGYNLSQLKDMLWKQLN